MRKGITPLAYSHTQQEQQTSRVFRPYGTLPDDWDAVPDEERVHYIAALPDTIAGLIRQFTGTALDLGRLGFDDPARYAVFRSKIFDERDRLLQLLLVWLQFWNLTDPDGTLADGVQEYLLDPTRWQ